MLIALRPAPPPSESAPLLALRADARVERPQLLSANAAGMLIRRSTTDQASDELCSALWQVSGGNPFQGAYHDNLDRPAGIKAACDPENLFRMNRSITPA